MKVPAPIREWRDVSAATFREEILPAGLPAVIRNAVSEWPAVRAGLESPSAIARYLRSFDAGSTAETMFGDPSIGGRFFYNDDLVGLNFERKPVPLAASLDQLLGLIDVENAPAIYVGAVPTPSSLPGFELANLLPFVDASVAPRVWFGNRVTVQTHYDLSYNIACVVAGRRRFTLFPPEQLINLYVGPLEFTLAGQPISMVRLDRPDFARYPLFREALESAVSAELAPGDALFIPYMWWHHVDSLERFNVLVNYWWDDAPPWNGSPFEAMLHGLMSIRSLPKERRELWRKVFDHYVFQTGIDPAAHLPPRRRGIQGIPSPELANFLRTHLIQVLSRRRW